VFAAHRDRDHGGFHVGWRRQISWYLEGQTVAAALGCEAGNDLFANDRGMKWRAPGRICKERVKVAHRADTCIGNPCEKFGSDYQLAALRTALGKHRRSLPNQRAIWVSSQNPQAKATSSPFSLVVCSKVIACCT
jgi:hypothetical protein